MSCFVDRSGRNKNRLSFFLIHSRSEAKEIQVPTISLALVFVAGLDLMLEEVPALVLRC